jgi:hypothetical protein
MDNEALKKWKEEKKIIDNWDIDSDIKELESQLAVLTQKTKDILEKLDDLESYKIIKERIYGGNAPVEFVEFDKINFKLKNI